MKNGIKILLAADAGASMALGLIGPIYAIFVEEIGGDILDASWAYFVYMFTCGILLWILSKWENRFKHKEKIVVAGYALTSIGCFTYIFVYNQTSLLITQVILGIAMALLSPAFDSLYSHYVNRRHEASDWGAWESMGYIVTALAALLGGFLAEYFSFRVLFVFMFIISLFGLASSLGLLKDRKFLES